MRNASEKEDIRAQLRQIQEEKERLRTRQQASVTKLQSSISKKQVLMERLSSAGPVKIVLEKPYSQSINGNINLNFYSINKDQTGADGAQGDEADGQSVEELELQK